MARMQEKSRCGSHLCPCYLAIRIILVIIIADNLIIIERVILFQCIYQLDTGFIFIILIIG